MARLGGDEFALLHPVSPTSKSLPSLANELVQSIARPYDVGGSQLTLTASIGVSVAGEACQEPDRMLKNADVALYRAKTDGRNAFRFYDPEHGQSSRGEARSRTRGAQRLGARRIRGALPADRRCPLRAHLRLRGAVALAPPRQGAVAAVGVHRHRRGGRLHHPARRMGAAQGLRRRGGLARLYAARGEHLARAMHARADADRHECAGRVAAAARPA